MDLLFDLFLGVGQQCKGLDSQKSSFLLCFPMPFFFKNVGFACMLGSEMIAIDIEVLKQEVGAFSKASFA